MPWKGLHRKRIVRRAQQLQMKVTRGSTELINQKAMLAIDKVQSYQSNGYDRKSDT
jgi:hypothetical protein